jgi:hypothetical protein
MRKSHYTEQQIASALQQAEQGTPVAEVTRKRAIRNRRFIVGRSDKKGFSAWQTFSSIWFAIFYCISSSG